MWKTKVATPTNTLMHFQPSWSVEMRQKVCIWCRRAVIYQPENALFFGIVYSVHNTHLLHKVIKIWKEEKFKKEIPGGLQKTVLILTYCLFWLMMMITTGSVFSVVALFGDIGKHWHEFHSKNGPNKQPFTMIYKKMKNK